jgi:DNA-directed RNA polymerase subunit RPC12/RpoP
MRKDGTLYKPGWKGDSKHHADAARGDTPHAGRAISVPSTTFTDNTWRGPSDTRIKNVVATEHAYYYYECPKCRTLNTDIKELGVDNCDNCGERFKLIGEHEKRKALPDRLPVRYHTHNWVDNEDGRLVCFGCGDQKDVKT